MVDVDLGPGGDDEGPGQPSEPARPLTPPLPDPGDRDRTRRRIAQVLVLALVIGAAAALGGRAVGERREAARLAAYAEVPGVSAGLRDPLQETLRVEAGRLLAVDGDTVLVRAPADGPAGLAALDAGSGAVRWSLDPAPPDLAETEGCVVDEVGGLAVCSAGSPQDAVLHLDLRDGALVARTPLPGDVVDWDLLDGDLLVAVREGARLVVVRVTPGLAEGDAPVPRWRVSVPLGGGGDARPLLLDARDGFVTVSGAVGAVVRADDGRLLGAWEPARGYRRVDVLTGPEGFGVWRSPLRGRWFDGDGRPVSDLPGGPVTERVTDGSAPEVVLTLTPLMTAVDLRTGEALWERGDGGYLQPPALPLRLDGMVVLPDGDRLLGVDVRTGDVRWSAPAPTTTQTLFSRPLTDGRRLVVTDLDEEGALVLRAIDLTTGEDAWVVPAPPASLWVYGVGGRGVMQGGGDVVVLG